MNTPPQVSCLEYRLTFDRCSHNQGELLGLVSVAITPVGGRTVLVSMKVCRDGNDLVLLVPTEYAHTSFPNGFYGVLEWISYYALQSESPRRKGRAPFYENGVGSECDWEFTDDVTWKLYIS